MITVIDYGSGNLRSVAKALEKSGGTVQISHRPEEIRQADRILLPGVGAFGDCRANLEQTQLLEPVLEHIRKGKPFLGICVGMQLLFSEGHEFGIHPGLGLFPGKVVEFPKDMPDPANAPLHLKVPHMGWNRVRQTVAHPLWQGIPQDTFFYFVHSFHGILDQPTMSAGESVYGMPFCAACARDNLFATQFHPEKSQTNGLRMLENFISWSP
ncbi:MAG: imidazole glycerol phosphate synthase subunit HisH [Magnetococcales bacterium]|nr:imidazole glycerol phosphate synthase subunit HisH [Magnetococcales bacterium]MBF0150212.1 imidazole glycerol phosphate synthase subunit HisH [Magnetococcales bacterium]MBF0174776.1 imidazole glycerol phosphate synthase subunit HisH [Magnetococcales bacterium]MBF0347900.1 imidazole glycerol phosphate synthase subunit HisH [Magnetococcales bacterium]MBF0631894.1 imidazole glycerol phosphate synthase subunit HisH [Magnetococcales bacterium]